MIYKNFQNLRLSALGFGAMRLPTVGNIPSKIDEPAAEKMVAYAMEHGINYFDTAWGYHDGRSEVALGKALGKYPRETWLLANKFPGYDLYNMDKVEAIFEEQLKRCCVEYFDFYMFHNVCEMNIDAYFDKKYGIFKHLWKQKESGRIKHLGFSAHGSTDVMKRFIEAYRDHLEFCQIQLNYVDWAFQDAKAKVDLLNEYNIPIWAMEPMRGGQIAALPEGDAAKLKALRPQENIPAWALRFIQSIPNITLTLTGASSLEQLRDNINAYQEEKPLNSQEMETLLGIAGSMVQKLAVPCTNCRYCLSHCPQGLDIPNLLGLYNEHNFTVTNGGFGFIAPMAISALPKEQRPGACTACKNCEAVCPQQIKISGALGDFVAKIG